MPLLAEGSEVPLPNSSGATAPSEAADVPARVRIKNRRKTYLDRHPEYFGPQLELADPLLYDRLVRRFQTPAEREAEGRRKGYSGVLEADLYRSEAKLEALQHPDPNALFTYRRGADGEILAEEKDEVPANKEEGLDRWKWEMEARFLRGADDDFDYDAVDKNSEYDDRVAEERDAQDRYFDEETPEFVGAEGDGEGEEEAVKNGSGSGSKAPDLKGETGVQDF